MPIGFQVFASWDRDRQLLDFAQACERSVGRYQWPLR
jgi:Asp-tRNA(Asn)/Glu-tRNA(Gln) amidotransferase A subunit family amidase